MTTHAAPWTSRAGVQLRGLCGLERELDVLNIAFMQASSDHKDCSTSELLKNLWCDVSQSCDRGKRYTYNAPCFSTSSCCYSFEKDVVLSGQAQFRALGWGCVPPPVPLELFSNHEARDLSGDAFAVPLATMATLCCYLNPKAPWWSQTQ